jgi:hypothetical protein
MRAGINESYEIRMREMTFPVRVLSIDEVARIRREAIAYSATNGGDETEKNIFIQKATLKLASTLTAGSAPVISDKLLERLSLDEVIYLFQAYISEIEKVNPAVDHLSPEQFRVIVDALKKNTISSKDLSIHQLRAICTSYVELIQRLESQS